MNQDFQNITTEQLCEIIDLIHPCMDDHLYVYDFVNDFYYISPTAEERFALPGNAFHNVARNLAQVVYPEDLPALQEDIRALLAQEKTEHNLQYRWRALDGQPLWINCRGHVVSRDGQAQYMVGCINEIGKRQKADNVSGLLGQSSLQYFMEELPVLSPNSYLIRLGLDKFKDINERMGIEYGDMILRKTAECIAGCMLPGQQLYRIVSDEFMIVDMIGSGKKDSISLYRDIRRAISRFISENSYEAIYTVSCGILQFQDIEDLSFPNIMKLSEFALSQAKQAGRNTCYVFQQTDYDKFLRTESLTRELRQAVSHNFEGFMAYYQPLFSAGTDKLYGAESLMRFRSEQFGMVSPAEFIPILEETGLIVPAGRWMTEQALTACKNIRQWVPEFRISINVSYVQIMKTDLLDELTSAIIRHELDPSAVIIELTESGLLESDLRFTRFWAKLKEFGILLALDDFGTGYSNFHYLNDLRPDIIKIDRSFTAKALESEYEYNLLSLMSRLVHDLNLKFCTEGIETAQERSRIQKLFPDYYQGFYFGKPCGYEDFLKQFVTAA